MNIKTCLVCGSSKLRADRALSGRLICISCGNPYGVRKSGSRNKSFIRSSTLSIKKLFIIILITVFIIAIFI